ncbi:hypothetical protein TNCV_2717141 [Trichonephila clavipes]|nr:hypothetical protein TNCV_2717141 [Trichonephila clavipes]
MLVRLSRAPVLSGGLRRKTQLSPVPSTWPLPPRPHLTSPKSLRSSKPAPSASFPRGAKKTNIEQSTLLSVGLWSGREKEEKENGLARKRAENREGSLGFPGFVKPVFTKDSKPLGRRKRSLGAPRERETRTHLKKVSPRGKFSWKLRLRRQSESTFSKQQMPVCEAVWPMRRRVNLTSVLRIGITGHAPMTRFQRVQFVIQLLTP